MSTQALSSRSLLGSLLLAGALSAQFPDGGQAPPPSSASSPMRTAFGLAELPEGLVAGGPSYKLHFEPASAQITPALGEAAPHNLPLRLTTLEAARDGAPLPAQASAPLRAGERRVSYARGAGWSERWDVGREGAELSFVFETLPEGAGDLCVRIALETELAFQGTEQGGLRFALEGVGGVHIGAVTGIDAAGRTSAGVLRYAEGELCLSLPADFVDAAALPLVIDPLLSPAIDVANTNAWNDLDPDVGFEPSQSRYLVAWERRFSSTDVDIRAQRIDMDGNLVGLLIFVENGNGIATEPAVASVRREQSFFVVWQEAASFLSVPQIRGRSVTSSSGTMPSTSIAIAPSASVQLDPVIAGEQTDTDDDVLVFWEEDGDVRGRQVTVIEDAAPFLLGEFLVADGGFADAVNPAVTQTFGDAGRALVVWEQVGSNGIGTIYGRMFTRNGSVLSDETPLSFVSGPIDDAKPSVAGAGPEYLVVFERAESFGSSFSDIHYQRVIYSGGELDPQSPFPPALENDDDDQETDPVVAYQNFQYVVAFADVDFDSTNVYVKTVQQGANAMCEGEFGASGTGDETRPAIAGARFESIGALESLLVYESFDGAESDVFANAFEGNTGSVSGVGGNCGLGGWTSATCATLGNLDFELNLSGAAPNSIAYLAVSVLPTAISCGSCTLIADPFGGALVGPLLTNGAGEVAQSLPLQPYSMLTGFYAQWGVVHPKPACTDFGLSMSNAVLVMLGNTP